MSLLTICKAVAMRVMKQTITQAVGNTDPKVLQMVELINEDGQELADRFSWQALVNEANFTTVATESQGTIVSKTGSDFNYILNETMWNRSQRRPVYGPKSPAEFQQLKAQFMQGPYIQYRLRGGNILFLPVPTAGQLIYFEWVTYNWCTDSTGVTGRASMTVDTDISKLPERLHILGGIWRWKAAQKLDYAADQEKYEIAVADTIGRDSSKQRLNLAGAQMDVYPGVLVPAGNWMQ